MRLPCFYFIILVLLVSLANAQTQQPKTVGYFSPQLSKKWSALETETQAELTASDRAAIIADLDQVFVNGWLTDDKKAVLSVFAPDAILLPPGSNAVIGLKDIGAYWFPNDGSVTKITGFDRKIEEIQGTRKLAFLRSTATLSWTYEKEGKKSAQTSRSIDLRLVTYDASGRWRVIRQMWTALPN